MANEKIYEIQLSSEEESYDTYDIYGKGLIYNEGETISFKYSDGGLNGWVSELSPIYVTSPAGRLTEIAPGEIIMEEASRQSVTLNSSGIIAPPGGFSLKDTVGNYQIGWESGKGFVMTNGFNDTIIHNSARDPFIIISAAETGNDFEGRIQVNNYEMRLILTDSATPLSEITLDSIEGISLRSTSSVKVNGSNVITAANFSYDTSTGTLTITTN